MTLKRLPRRTDTSLRFLLLIFNKKSRKVLFLHLQFTSFEMSLTLLIHTGNRFMRLCRPACASSEDTLHGTAKWAWPSWILKDLEKCFPWKICNKSHHFVWNTDLLGLLSCKIPNSPHFALCISQMCGDAHVSYRKSIKINFCDLHKAFKVLCVLFTQL